MRAAHRLWHALFGHQELKVDLTREPWSASCDCGYRFHVQEFSMGKLGTT